MVNLSDAVNLLRAKRKELSDQLDAVDAALAALGDPAIIAKGPEPTPHEVPAEAPTEVRPTRVKSPKTLTDEHKHALKDGRRKARHSKEAAAGRAREMPDPRPGLAPASNADGRHPRLVKQTRL